MSVKPRILHAVIPLALVALATGCQRKDVVDQELAAKLVQPVARVELAGAPAAAAGSRTGEEIYKAVCSACHDSGAAGAPKAGDKGAWAARIGQGLDGLLKSATNGKNAMPPKGGAADLTDAELARVVVFLANKGGASFKEPAAK
jgi:cytochrome c5